MLLIEKEQHILLKNSIHSNFKNEIERDEYVKNNNLVSFKPFRLSNIMIEILISNIVKIPDNIIIYFFNEDLTNKYGRTHYFHTYNIKKIKLNDFTKYIILDTDTYSTENVSHIGFSSKSLREDFEFELMLKKKYTYQIHAGRRSTEFWYNDGCCHHEEGDNFTHFSGMELSVMNINHELKIINCMARFNFNEIL